MFPPLPALSGLEVARALMLAGFRLSNRGEGPMLLDRGWRTVTVPHADAVAAPDLQRLLSAAGISPAEFLVLLDRRHPANANKAE